MAVGSLVLVGWLLEIEALKGAGHSITMKPNAAIGLIACGIALLNGSCGGSYAGWRRLLTLASGSLVIVLGASTLFQHLTGWNLGIDELLFREAPGAIGTASPNRMGPNASLSLCLAGFAFLLLQHRSERAARRAQALAFCMTVLAAIALVGYIYGAQQLYSATRYTGIAWPTALALLTIAIGILASRADTGPVSVLLSDGPGGMMARRVLVPAILLPVTLGYLRKTGEAANLYDAGLGGALLAVSVAMILAVAIWRAALRLDESNRARELAQRERDELLVRERAARDNAERASLLKDQFLATLSHELRTPLNAIVGWADILRSAPVDAERRLRGVEVIARNGQVLATLVEDLLDVSRIVSGKLRIRRETVDLAAITSSAVDDLMAAANAKRVTLRWQTGVESALVTGDPDRLQQAVGNVIGNAIKFTPEDGTIHVQLAAAEGMVTLTVRDDGLGIDPAFLPYIFDPFRQQDPSTTREHSGLGLGLSIVRDLIDLHDGKVTAFSEGRGKGSTFTIRLPLLQAADGSTPAA